MGEHKRKGKTRFYLGAGKRRNATVLIIVVCVVVVGVIDFINRTKQSPLKAFIPERTKGSPQAPLQIVEFADFQCSECARGSRMISEYMEKYPDGIRFTMKYFPLGELNSTISALYAECAARQGQFWVMHDYLFKTQSEWRTLLRINPFFDQLAQDAKLDVEEIRNCVERDDVKAVVAKEELLGESFSIQATPTYFINEEMVVGVKELQRRLDKHFQAGQDGSLSL